MLIYNNNNNKKIKTSTIRVNKKRQTHTNQSVVHRKKSRVHTNKKSKKKISVGAAIKKQIKLTKKNKKFLQQLGLKIKN